MSTLSGGFFYVRNFVAIFSSRTENLDIYPYDILQYSNFFKKYFVIKYIVFSYNCLFFLKRSKFRAK